MGMTSVNVGVCVWVCERTGCSCLALPCPALPCPALPCPHLPTCPYSRRVRGEEKQGYRLHAYLTFCALACGGFWLDAGLYDNKPLPLRSGCEDVGFAIRFQVLVPVGLSSSSSTSSSLSLFGLRGGRAFKLPRCLPIRSNSPAWA